MNSKGLGKQKPLHYTGAEITDPGNETYADHYCDSLPYCPTPYWINEDASQDDYGQECGISKWNQWCDCHKDVMDAANQVHFFEDGVYYCSMSGNSNGPCLSEYQCMQQAWMDACVCQVEPWLGSGTCQGYMCHGCHTWNQEFADNFGTQFWYYPSWFVDICIPPFDFSDYYQDESGETEPPGRDGVGFLIPDYRRAGGDIRRTNSTNRKRKTNLKRKRNSSSRENCPCCTEGPGQTVILCEQGSYVGMQNNCTLGANPPGAEYIGNVGCGTAEHQNWTVPCICECDCSNTGSGGPDSHFPGTGPGYGGGYDPSQPIDTTQSNTMGRIGKRGGNIRRSKGNTGNDNMIDEYHTDCCQNPGACGSYMVEIQCVTNDMGAIVDVIFAAQIAEFGGCGDCQTQETQEDLAFACGLTDMQSGHSGYSCGDMKWCPCTCRAFDNGVCPGSDDSNIGWSQQTKPPGRIGKRGGNIRRSKKGRNKKNINEDPQVTQSRIDCEAACHHLYGNSGNDCQSGTYSCNSGGPGPGCDCSMNVLSGNMCQYMCSNTNNDWQACINVCQAGGTGGGSGSGRVGPGQLNQGWNQQSGTMGRGRKGGSIGRSNHLTKRKGGVVKGFKRKKGRF